jgi:hypothetical protein
MNPYANPMQRKKKIKKKPATLHKTFEQESASVLAIRGWNHLLAHHSPFFWIYMFYDCWVIKPQVYSVQLKQDVRQG